jgi:hypothetical protein
MLTLSVTLSTSYAANLRLDDKLKVLSYTERSLSWVHSTLCHGGRIISTENGDENVNLKGKRGYHCVDQGNNNTEGKNDVNKDITEGNKDTCGSRNSTNMKIGNNKSNNNISNNGDKKENTMDMNSLFVLRDHDLRFMLSTSEPINNDDSAYKLFYPSSDSTPPVAIVNEQLVKADHISKETFAKISYVRYAQERIAMTCQNSQCTMPFKAQITRGTIHEAQKLATRSDFIDLSLHADCSVLIDWLHSGRQDNTVVHKWAADVARHGLAVSKSLKACKDISQARP